MVFKDLREFIAFLEKKNQLVRVGVEVDPVLEMTEIADRVMKANGSALLFEKPKGFDYPVLINTFGSYERMSWALGVDTLDDAGRKILGLIPNDVPTNLWDKVGTLMKMKDIAGIFPKVVKNASCQEVVETDCFSLDSLPILKCWPQDGGRFITLPLVITKDSKSGRQNVGMYRLQVYDGRTTGMHWHLHHDGAENYRVHQREGTPMEVAVALGGDPVTIYAATAPLPHMIGELLFAGFLRGEPVEVVRAKTVDLMVPAHAEFILEGYVDPTETRLEGPFGDHTGYYSLAEDFPVFHLTAITRRKNPIYPATIVGKPPMEDCYMGKATERIFLPILKTQLPEVEDINMPLEGVFHNCVYVSIKKSYPGHALKVMHGLWGLGQMMLAKMIVIVDESVDVQDQSEVLWKIFNNVDPARDIVITKGPLDVLDHSAPQPRFGSKMGIDATKKWPDEGHNREWPDEIEMNEIIKRLVDGRWKDYGIK
ncbi:MAG: menaquinone biosynthesis decarboxylase [Actinobacteria bacterium]|nr:menaquinone biosynthesis decarboxylase [Actinomycetota bacterium]